MLSILGVPYALPLAVVVFLLDLVPLVGATLGAIIVGVVTLFSDFPTDTIIWVIFSVIYQQVENTVIQPRIQARAVAVHPFVVLVSVLFGSTLFGVLGALLAIPVAAAIQITIREYHAFRNTPAEDLPPPGVPAPEVDRRQRRPSSTRGRRAAGQQPGHRRDPAAEHEARDGGADHHLLLVVAQVLAPVGDLGDLAAQLLDREAELGAVGLDRAPDLLRCACAGHQRLASARAAGSDDSVRPPAPIGLRGPRALHGLLDQLGLLDGHRRRGRRAALDEARAPGSRRGRRAAAGCRPRSGSRARRS